jgi:hypothetical protein
MASRLRSVLRLRAGCRPVARRPGTVAGHPRSHTALESGRRGGHTAGHGAARRRQRVAFLRHVRRLRFTSSTMIHRVSCASHGAWRRQARSPPRGPWTPPVSYDMPRSRPGPRPDTPNAGEIRGQFSAAATKLPVCAGPAAARGRPRGPRAAAGTSRWGRRAPTALPAARQREALGGAAAAVRLSNIGRILV